MHQETVLIRRASSDPATPGDVYVTGPHFGADVYSSTRLVSEASRFEEEAANNLIATGHWRTSSPHLVPVEQAADLK